MGDVVRIFVFSFNDMAGEILHFFTLAGKAPWATTWLCGKRKYLEVFLSNITMRSD